MDKVRRAAAGVAVLILAAAGLPAAAQDSRPASAPAPLPWPAGPDIDPANPLPWPAGWTDPSVVETLPSRFDRAPLQEVLAAAREGSAEAAFVRYRRLRAGEPAFLAWARAGQSAADPDALIDRGRILTGDGQGVGEDPAEGARLYRLAADLGNVEAMRRVGAAYASGTGVTRDLAQAVFWLKRAAEAGDRLAAFSLANRLRNDGDPTNDAEAEAWSQRSAAGVAVAPPKRSYRAEDLTPAALAGDVAAMRELGSLYESGFGIVTPDPAKGFHWMSMAAEKGDPFAMAFVGEMYRDGKGTPRDVARGLDWLNKSAQAGVRIAMYHLYHTYKDGKGVPADPATAQTWSYRLFWARDPRPEPPNVTPIPLASGRP